MLNMCIVQGADTVTVASFRRAFQAGDGPGCPINHTKRPLPPRVRTPSLHSGRRHAPDRWSAERAHQRHGPLTDSDSGGVSYRARIWAAQHRECAPAPGQGSMRRDGGRGSGLDLPLCVKRLIVGRQCAQKHEARYRTLVTTQRFTVLTVPMTRWYEALS